jgi:hypothetical protein
MRSGARWGWSPRTPVDQPGRARLDRRPEPGHLAARRADGPARRPTARRPPPAESSSPGVRDPFGPPIQVPAFVFRGVRRSGPLPPQRGVLAGGRRAAGVARGPSSCSRSRTCGSEGRSSQAVGFSPASSIVVRALRRVVSRSASRASAAAQAPARRRWCSRHPPGRRSADGCGRRSAYGCGARRRATGAGRPALGRLRADRARRVREGRAAATGTLVRGHHVGRLWSLVAVVG